jgi:Icc-related predicted phosphoesterase
LIRIAAFGDCHFAEDAAGTLAPALVHIAEQADVLLLAGDLTRVGTAAEAEALAHELRDVAVPMAAVLGNHDYHSDREKEVADVLREAGIHVLEGDAVVVDTPAGTVGVAGVKGFGTGFPGAMCSDFGEPEMKAFVHHSHAAAERLREALATVQDADARVALMHYAPVEDTLRGERLEIFPFMGSYHLAEAIDDGGADIAIHGHAHGGSEKGMTPGGVPVRNVAQPVLRASYRVYCLSGNGLEVCA